ncbi:MAG: hypothetical protein ACO38K_00115 [Ilumatobacteraceae bacterium]
MSRRRSLAGALTLLVVVFGASACGVFGGDDTATETTVAATTVPATTSVVVSTTDAGRVLEVSAELFAALGSGDAAVLASASSLVTPGSPAAVLVAHQATVAALAAEVILPEASSTTTSTPAESTVTDTTVLDTTTTTESVLPVDVVYADAVFDDEGLVRSFSVNGVSIDSLVREAGPVSVVEGVQGRIASAYRTAAGRVSVLFDVTAADEALSVFGFAAVHRARTISDGSSGLTEAFGAWGVDSVSAGASSRMLVVFDDGALDGEVLVTVLTESGVDLDLALPLIAP